MARGDSGMGPMGVIVSVVTGVVVLIALYAFIPMIGYQIDSSTTVTGAWASQSLTNASEIWTQVSPLPVLAILAVFISVAIGYFVMIGRR